MLSHKLITKRQMELAKKEGKFRVYPIFDAIAHEWIVRLTDGKNDVCLCVCNGAYECDAVITVVRSLHDGKISREKGIEMLKGCL